MQKKDKAKIVFLKYLEKWVPPEKKKGTYLVNTLKNWGLIHFH